MLKFLRDNWFKKPTAIEAIRFKNLFLPSLRTNQGLSDNETYLASGVEQISFLKRENLLNDHTRLLDFGCGQGRFLNSLIFSETSFKHYWGIDTHLPSIAWCRQYLRYSRNIRFIHLPAYNARYSPKQAGRRVLPRRTRGVDLVFANSVFSHLLEEDVTFYLEQFRRVLVDGGHVYLTAFLERGVPPLSENPEGYLGASKGPLHRVRYEIEFFLSIARRTGFKVRGFYHQMIDRTGQSVIVLQRYVD